MKKIEKVNVADIFELSTVQKGMLFHYLKETDANLYNVQLAFNIEGSLDTATLRQAFTAVQAKHEVLRSVFSWELSSKPLQIILKSCPVQFAEHDVSGRTPEEIGLLVKDYLHQDQQARFDLSGLPVRLGVIRTGERSFVFHITHHHILYDGWSTAILLKELFHCYGRLSRGQQPALDIKPAYKEVLRNAQQQSHGAEAELFWSEYLKDYKLTALFERSNAISGVGRVRVRIPMQQIDAFAKKHKVTRTALVYAAYGMLLLKSNNVTDIVFGTTISDRDPAVQGLDQQVGNFVNTVPLRLANVNDHSLAEAVEEINRQLISRNQFHGTSLYEIKQMLGLQPDEHLFDSTVGIKNYPVDEGLVKSVDGLDIQLRSVYENTDVSLAVSVFFKQELELEFDYKTGVLDEQQVQLFADHLTKVLHEIVNDPGKKLSGLCLLPDEERELILHKFNATEKAYPTHVSIVDMFEQQVRLTPRNTAIVHEGKKLSYAALNEKADQLAAFLQQAGVGSNDVVALMIEPSLELVIGMIGILKAGAAYLPMSPDNPPARTEAMCAETKCKVLLTQEVLADPQTYAAAVRKRPVVAPGNLLYIIYTSGTTGVPKGVMLTHGNMVNYVHWGRSFLQLSQADRWALTHSFTFDAANTAIFNALLSGAALHLLPKELYTSPGELLDYLQLHGITHMKMTPSLYATVAEHADLEKIGTLKLLMQGGEKINVSDIEKTFIAAPHIQIVNHYGPTETTVGSIARYVSRADMHQYKHHPSVGKPISNTRCYILDNAKGLVPVGDKGELYISGHGLAKGYIGREDLTREKFVDNPFEPGALMYKTGDVARWLPDGNIEFLGRIDNQVKIRGYRVELGEIETQ
ncbi:MAG TPA: amino acid adenylation domain-containing protein, partial [Chitinophagaceae bacterium]|nr:amino acid adenylation domain-containing protein [Chitinophagaceae bacterium]